MNELPSSLPPLETPQTARIRASYPPIEYLEDGYVADWLKERGDQLLELAREEQSGINCSKIISSAVLAGGFFCHALSPLAPVGALFGIVGYVHSCFLDANSTGNFSLLPFVRGNVLDLAGTLGNSELRSQVNGDVAEFERLQHYLPSNERKEHDLIDTHFVPLTAYLTQVEPLKRFPAYRWILDCFTKHQALPSPQQVSDHMKNVAADLRVNHKYLDAIKERRSLLAARNENKPGIEDINNPPLMPYVEPVKLPPSTSQPPLGIGSDTRLNAINVSADASTPPHVPPTKAPETADTGLKKLLSVEPVKRANAFIELLNRNGLDLAKCIQGQITAIAGNQRGGKGTLMAILAILSKALNPSTKIHYFTAGDDVYPFQCDRLICRYSFPKSSGSDADGLVAQSLLKYFQSMDNAPQASYDNVILVIDEAVTLSGCLDSTQKEWMIKFLLTRASKKGAQIFIVLHGDNLSSWVGKNTNGMAHTFKTGVSFIGCESKKVQVETLRSIDIATGRYFLAESENFSKPKKGGEIGIMPEWMKAEKNPINGQPDPVRTLLTIFPELIDESPTSTARRGADEVEFKQVDMFAQLESLWQLEAPEREANDDISIELKESLSIQVLEIMSKAVNHPISFDALRKSRMWEYFPEGKQPTKQVLRDVLRYLVDSQKIEGNEEAGYLFVNNNS